MLFQIEEDKDRKPCRQVFRFRKSSYFSDSRLTYNTEWIKMKKKSCSGECDSDRCFCPIEDAYEAGLDCLRIDFPNDLKNGTLCEAILVSDYVCPETGYTEEWHWKMVPLRENEGA